ncbi:MAG TPA: 50S ribosomal protein L6, partial [Phototrophicaceae bacterium]|nr:50S ribosomal protein L6 [Phototrophicaceae bacterium]
MSRIGKQPVQIPDKVTVTVHGQEVTVKGPKGELKHNVHPNIHVQHSAGVLHLSRQDDERASR